MADMLGLLVILFPGAIVFLILCNGGMKHHILNLVFIFLEYNHIFLSALFEITLRSS